MTRLGQVFQTHQSRLLRMIERRIDPSLASRCDADDILNDAFVRAMEKWTQYDPTTMSTYAWIYRITLDCLIEAWRSANAACRSIQLEEPWPERSSVQLGLGLVDSLTSPSEALDRKERHELVARAVQQLKPTDREILAMRHFDGLSYGEAGAILNISEHAATVRYARALLRLKQVWRQIESCPESVS
jgi:RNA polymerase sigma-70 factor (ECF subfamily)